jgi:hypothetical protein
LRLRSRGLARAGRKLRCGLGIEAEAKDLYQRGRQWAVVAEDPEAAAWLVGSYAGVRCVAGRLNEAVAILDEFAALAAPSPSPDLAIIGDSYRGYLLTHFGKLEEAEQRLLLASSRSNRRSPFNFPGLSRL